MVGWSREWREKKGPASASAYGNPGPGNNNTNNSADRGGKSSKFDSSWEIDKPACVSKQSHNEYFKDWVKLSDLERVKKGMNLERYKDLADWSA